MIKIYQIQVSPMNEWKALIITLAGAKILIIKIGEKF